MKNNFYSKIVHSLKRQKYNMMALLFRHFDNVQLTQSVKHMQKYRGNEYELKISRVKMEDKGEYIVKAENSFGRREELGILKVDRKSEDLYLVLHLMHQ